MSQFEHESDDQSAAANELVRELKREKTYDVTIIVKGSGGRVTAKFHGIPRERIFAERYPTAIRSAVEIYESSIEPYAGEEQT